MPACTTRAARSRRVRAPGADNSLKKPVSNGTCPTSSAASSSLPGTIRIYLRCEGLSKGHSQMECPTCVGSRGAP